jgi:hypothetical protein
MGAPSEEAGASTAALTLAADAALRRMLWPTDDERGESNRGLWALEPWSGEEPAMVRARAIDRWWKGGSADVCTPKNVTSHSCRVSSSHLSSRNG